MLWAFCGFIVLFIAIGVAFIYISTKGSKGNINLTEKSSPSTKSDIPVVKATKVSKISTNEINKKPVAKVESEAKSVTKVNKSKRAINASTTKKITKPISKVASKNKITSKK